MSNSSKFSNLTTQMPTSLKAQSRVPLNDFFLSNVLISYLGM